MITKVAISGYRSLREDWAQVPQRRDRGQWQRQVEPLSRAALAGGHRARAHHSVVGGGGRASFHAVGRPESFARSVKRGEQPVQGTVRKARAHEEQISQRAVGQLGSLQGTEQPVLPHLVLEKHLSETLVQDDERPAWTWPSR